MQSRFSSPATAAAPSNARTAENETDANWLVDIGPVLSLDSLPPPAPGEPEIVARMREGLVSIERNFLNVLERNGIKREDPTGVPFDPNLHQAMAEQESAAHPPGTVMHAWTQGWTLNGRLLRPAMVVVAKAPPDELTAERGTVDTTA